MQVAREDSFKFWVRYFFGASLKKLTKKREREVEWMREEGRSIILLNGAEGEGWVERAWPFCFLSTTIPKIWKKITGAIQRLKVRRRREKREGGRKKGGDETTRYGSW
jgi:hypothetical protein